MPCFTSIWAKHGWGGSSLWQLEHRAGTWATSVTTGACYCIISAKQDIVQEKNGVPLPLAKLHNSHLASGFLILKSRKWDWRFLQEDEANEPGFPHPDKCLTELLTQKKTGIKSASALTANRMNCFVVNLKCHWVKKTLIEQKDFTFIMLNLRQL